MDAPQKYGMTTAELCRNADCAIDLTEFSWDGGGAQYTFLEAMDAGCSLIINRKWTQYAGEMRDGYNCHVAGSADELVALVSDHITPNYDMYLETLYAHAANACVPILIHDVFQLPGHFRLSIRDMR